VRVCLPALVCHVLCVSGDKDKKVKGIFIVAQDITLTRRLLQERKLVADQWEYFIKTANAPVPRSDKSASW
jgi:hypothetical protein